MSFSAPTSSLDTSSSLLWDGVKTMVMRPYLFPKCVHWEGLLTDTAVTTIWITEHLQILHKLGDFNLIHKQSNKIKGKNKTNRHLKISLVFFSTANKSDYGSKVIEFFSLSC